jgi:hypothetical protein
MDPPAVLVAAVRARVGPAAWILRRQVEWARKETGMPDVNTVRASRGSS